MQRITDEFPEASFNIPTTEAGEPVVRQQVEQIKGRVPFSLKRDAFDELVSKCDLCITKSGTSTLHVAAWNVPMIVVYRLSPLIWHLVGRWLVKTKKIALVNILAGQIDLVPEFIPWHGSNQPVADCAIDLLKHPAKLDDQRSKLAALIRTLDKPGASLNTAKIALSLM